MGYTDTLSRDETVPHNHKLSLFIYNLEPSYMNGSRWVATYVKDRVINYFDSFGMPPFQEIVRHAKERNLTLLHQNRQIQNHYTSTCGLFVEKYLKKNSLIVASFVLICVQNDLFVFSNFSFIRTAQ